MKGLALALGVAVIAMAESPFAFRETGSAALELTDKGKPVLVYNHGMQLKPGVPEDRRRCCYVHPLYAPDGTVLTDDFPADHYHHRGVFWAWPIVRVGGQTFDMWTIRGFHQRFERRVERKAEPRMARMAVENGWYVGDRRVAKEVVEIAALPAVDRSRELRFTLTFEALDGPIELAGEPAEQKGYGGFCVRFAPRDRTAISTPRGRETADTNMARHPWARLEALFGGRPAGLRIEVDPDNPGFPNGWCLRHYGFLGVNFPGLGTHTLLPGRPLVWKLKVLVYNPANAAASAP